MNENYVVKCIEDGSMSILESASEVYQLLLKGTHVMGELNFVGLSEVNDILLEKMKEECNK
jgi:hypothetical protein